MKDTKQLLNTLKNIKDMITAGRSDVALVILEDQIKFFDGVVKNANRTEEK